MYIILFMMIKTKKMLMDEPGNVFSNPGSDMF